MSELDGMAKLTEQIHAQVFPHTVDAQVWADEWLKTITTYPEIATDRGAMIGWFANAIMAGWDTACMKLATRGK